MSGVNEYSGEIFSNITRGDTVPFTFTFLDSAGAALPVTGWKMYISFNAELDSSKPSLEVEIPISDGPGGIFSGEISDEDTYSLESGDWYVTASYVKSSGSHHIVDMAKIRVYESNTDRTDQT